MMKPELTGARLPQDITHLNLAGAALAGALELQRLHPNVVFTSGRRSLADQARVMARNVARNRQYIGQTYANAQVRDELQGWVNRHPGASESQLQEGLGEILAAWPSEKLEKLSRHLVGMAFDVRPIPGGAGEAVKRSISRLPGLHKFLDREGGLVIWHAQFL